MTHDMRKSPASMVADGHACMQQTHDKSDYHSAGRRSSLSTGNIIITMGRIQQPANLISNTKKKLILGNACAPADYQTLPQYLNFFGNPSKLTSSPYM